MRLQKFLIFAYTSVVASRYFPIFLSGYLFAFLIHTTLLPLEPWSFRFCFTDPHNKQVKSPLDAGGRSEMVNQDFEEMDAVAGRTGTDKASIAHNFTRIYSKAFTHLRNKPIRFLEIGIHKGGSVQLWEWYFPRAELHFIDSNESVIEYHSTRSTYHIFDPADAGRLRDFATRYGPFDVILDDGGHSSDQQLTILDAMLPFVRPGGMFVVEDLHTSYWGMYGGGGGTSDKPIAGPNTAITFLKHLIDQVNYIGAITKYGNTYNLPSYIRARLSYYSLHIDYMTFYNSVCIIQMK